ncbi:UNVERIFIED_CONTAM: hypothetical protein NCL1_13525 [Trichonephila clavipes]
MLLTEPDHTIPATELFQTLSVAVQTTIVGKTAIKPPVLNRSVFTIVRFLNIPCSSINGKLTGICYSLTDCVRMHGAQVGTCASGFVIACEWYVFNKLKTMHDF